MRMDRPDEMLLRSNFWCSLLEQGLGWLLRFFSHFWFSCLMIQPIGSFYKNTIRTLFIKLYAFPVLSLQNIMYIMNVIDDRCKDTFLPFEADILIIK